MLYTTILYDEADSVIYEASNALTYDDKTIRTLFYDTKSYSIDISTYDIDDLAIAMDIYFPQNDGDCSEGQLYSEEARLNILLDDTEVEIPIYGYTDEWDNPVDGWFTRQFELGDLFDDIDDINLDDTPGNTLQFAIEYSDCGGNWGYGIAVDNIVLRTPTDFNLLGYYIYRNDLYSFYQN